MAKKNTNNCVVLRLSEKTQEKLIKYYKRKLVDYGAIKELRNSYKAMNGKFKKVRGKVVNV